MAARPAPPGWQRLVADDPGYAAAGRFPLPAYSEFMPAPRLGWTPLGGQDLGQFSADDPYGWLISEIEEQYELRPGLGRLARQVLEPLVRLGSGLPVHAMAGNRRENLEGNPYWPPELATRAGSLAHERYVTLLPLALSRTQDDKGRVLWTLFGSSELGPEAAFWKSFFSAPDRERPADECLPFLYRLLQAVYGVTAAASSDLRAAGLRILPTAAGAAQLPSWTRPLLVDAAEPFDSVRFLLTFHPFAELPKAARERYLDGRLNLLPFPGSLVFWGMPGYMRLARRLPQALQIPLLHLAARHGGPDGLRVPQSGWLHEPRPNRSVPAVQPELLRHTVSRTNRWDRVARSVDEAELNLRLEKVSRVLFSTDLQVLGLYDKPMARNCQLWSDDFEPLLDGPHATPEELTRAETILAAGGLFGYRFLFPPMQVGRYAVTWHRPLAAFLSPLTGQAELLPDAPLGFLAACPASPDDPSTPLELWPRLQCRPEALSALLDFPGLHDHYTHQTALNLLTLIDVWERTGRQRLPRPFARSLLRIAEASSLEAWLAELPAHAADPERGRTMQAFLAGRLELPGTPEPLSAPLTFAATARRDFEEAYWNDIQALAEGEFVNKESADVVLDEATRASLDPAHARRELDRLGDTLLARQRRAVRAAGMEGRALVGELLFAWHTDFAFQLFGGWRQGQDGSGAERDLLVVIPGRDRRRAVILADHYDTAYEEDTYDIGRGGSGARRSAAGADDNYSATSTLLQAAPIFLRLAAEGRLECDVWLLHLTGEEFPADCLGARYFCQAMVERTLSLRLEDGRRVDLSGTRPAGVLLMDMIAHNRDYEHDIFQISPGNSPESLALARLAQAVSRAWNAGTREWNHSPERQGLGRGRRSLDGKTIPAPAAALALNGEVRTRDDPASSLYNTDGQIFSDVGAPVVLFMENYDINRSGYHDTHDTLANIDLDYGAALAAIVIETAAQLATKA